MNSRLVAGGLIWGALLAVPVIAHAADSRPATRSTGQTVGRATSLAVPRLSTQRTGKSAASNSAAGRMQFASPLKLPAKASVLAAIQSASRAEKLHSQPARSNNSTFTGPRSSSGVLQLVPTNASQPTGQKVLTLLPQPESGQKVLTLLPPSQPPAANQTAQILQFPSEDKQESSATIMPLGVSQKSEPAATLLQFED